MEVGGGSRTAGKPETTIDGQPGDFWPGLSGLCQFREWLHGSGKLTLSGHPSRFQKCVREVMGASVRPVGPQRIDHQVSDQDSGRTEVLGESDKSGSTEGVGPR